MMFDFSRISIRRKLTLMLLLTSAAALLASGIGFAIADWVTVRQATFDRMRAEAEIIGSNSVAALTFADPDAAVRTLETLASESDVIAAALFGRDGELFASYRRSDVAFPTISPGEESGEVGGLLYVLVPVILDTHQIGRVMIVSDLSYWRQRQVSHLVVAAAVLALSLLIALLLAGRMQRMVSVPILRLADTARRISETRDYRLRTEKLTADEIGRLADDFNGMLEQIQLRDHELRQAREHLEDQVAARTAELTELTHELEHQAYHDTLTGLANRITFDDRLQFAIAQAQRNHERLAVLFLDLDRFKVINDTLGHAIGDLVLIEVARRLRTCLRQSDTLGRFGGDEFSVLLPQVESVEDVTEVARKLTDAISVPVSVNGYTLHISTSIGITLFPDDGASGELLMKNADTAMYRSKDQGRNQFCFFSAEMNVRAARRLTLESKLRTAIHEQNLRVHYQSRRDARTDRIIGVEALARWHDPEEGEVSPCEFIALAEECGLIARVDEWVLETACREILECFAGARPGISLSVNISPTQLIRKDLVSVMRRILGRTGFPGDLLELEITENVFGMGAEDVNEILGEVHQLGVEVSVDDFGTAYSSLSRLKQLPLQTLKIDKSFIRDLGSDPDDEIIVRTIISMAHGLNLRVVAEGVENRSQLEFVRRHGCDAVQGFLFGRPMPAAELAALLAAEGIGPATADR